MAGSAECAVHYCAAVQSCDPAILCAAILGIEYPGKDYLAAAFFHFQPRYSKFSAARAPRSLARPASSPTTAYQDSGPASHPAGQSASRRAVSSPARHERRIQSLSHDAIVPLHQRILSSSLPTGASLVAASWHDDKRGPVPSCTRPTAMSHPPQDQDNSAQGERKGERKSRRRQLMKHVLPARLFRWNCVRTVDRRSAGTGALVMKQPDVVRLLGGRGIARSRPERPRRQRVSPAYSISTYGVRGSVGPVDRRSFS